MDPLIKEVFDNVIEKNHIESDTELIEWIKHNVGYLNYEQTLVVKEKWHIISK